MVAGLHELVGFSSFTRVLDVGLFCIVPPRQHSGSVTGVSCYFMSLIFTFSSKIRKLMFSKSTLAIAKATTFLSNMPKL